QDLRPVVDRSGDRVFRGQLHEAERDGELAEEHHRPGPEVRRPGGAEAEVEELKGAGEYRDVTDAGREAAERTNAAGERFLVAEVLHAAVNIVQALDPGALVTGSCCFMPGNATRRPRRRPASNRRER